MNDTSATSVPPRVLLPTGITTDFRPRIEWKWPGSASVEAWHVRVGLTEHDGHYVTIWESATLPGDTRFTHPDVDLASHESLMAEIRPRVNGEWHAWGIASHFRIQPVPPAQDSIVIYDLDYTRKLSPMQAFAHAHLVSALQGLANRHKPSLYIKFVKVGHARSPHHDIDQLWLDRLDNPDGGWLSETSIRTASSLPDLLDIFGNVFNGAVVWDPAVPATSNLASIIAGADDLLPVPCCNDASSLYTDLIAGLRIPVVVDLRGKFTGRGTIPDTARPSTGSAKCDAYLWAVERYLATGKCNPQWMGHYLDSWWLYNPGAGGNWQNHTLTNHDYFIARCAFFWDLNVWPDEAPVDDPDQPLGADASTLHEILTVANRVLANNKMIHVGGFTPWSFKYTNHSGAGGKHEPVDTEWELTRILSSYNAYVDADALGLGAMANASFLHYFPLPPTYAPVLAATPAELQAEGLLTTDNKPTGHNYILNYVGDYDSAAWAWNTLTRNWESPARGTVPLAWAINPNLADRAAPLFEHLYRTRTASDHFMTGDSGAGYINPTQLLSPREPSGLPDAADLWQRHCRPWYQRFGLRFTGFLINGHCGVITPQAEQMYLALSPDGIVNQYGRTTDKLHFVGDTMPAFELLHDIDDLDTGIAIMQQKAREMGARPLFMVFRQILKKPDYYVELLQRLSHPDSELLPVFCDPHTFGCLARAHVGHTNDDQAMPLFSAIPCTNVTGCRCRADIAFRNDGWNSWKSPEHTLLIKVARAGARETIWQRHWPLTHEVEPGESVLFRINIPIPDFQGTYHFTIDMARNGTPFSERRGLPAELTVVAHRPAPAITV